MLKPLRIFCRAQQPQIPPKSISSKEVLESKVGWLGVTRHEKSADSIGCMLCIYFATQTSRQEKRRYLLQHNLAQFLRYLCSSRRIKPLLPTKRNLAVKSCAKDSRSATSNLSNIFTLEGIFKSKCSPKSFRLLSSKMNRVQSRAAIYLPRRDPKQHDSGASAKGQPNNSTHYNFQSDLSIQILSPNSDL